METHAHHLHKTPGRGWKHYFFEFLMLFLAVFCGFLAENFREKQEEDKKAKQYIFSFYNDLKADTTEISRQMAFYGSVVDALENRRDCYDSLDKLKPSHCLLNIFRHCLGFPDFVNSDETLLQLEHSGNFRLLDEQDIDSILTYDKMIRVYIKNETTSFQENQTYIRDVAYSMWNYAWTPHLQESSNVPFLFRDKTELVNRFFNLLDDYYFNCRNNLDLLKNLKARAEDHIEYLKKKYKLQ